MRVACLRRGRCALPRRLSSREFDSLQFGDVLKRVAGDGDDVRIFAFFDGADLVLPAHHLRGRCGGGLNRLRCGHAVADHPLEFERRETVGVGIPVDAAAEGDFDSLGQGYSKSARSCTSGRLYLPPVACLSCSTISGME